MCHYITAAIPARIDLASLKDVFKEHDISFEPVTSEHVEKQLPPGMRYLVKKSGFCDCGTVIGFISQRGDDGIVIEKESRKLRKKGWGETKIDRVLEEKHRSAQHKTMSTNILARDRVPEGEEWIALIRDVLSIGRLKSLGLLLHWYDSRLDTEHIDLKRTVRTPVDQINPDVIMRIEEDVLYVFTSHA